MYQSKLHSPIGILKITGNDAYITHVCLVKEDFVEKPNCLTEEAKKQLQEYFNHQRTKFDLPIGLSVKDFEYKVLQELSKVDYGKTISYGQLGERSGFPKSARAVGNAIHKNPLLIIIPCHRVIKSDGSLGGFGCGIDAKMALLKIEGVI